LVFLFENNEMQINTIINKEIFLQQFNLRVIKAKADGLCFINSLILYNGYILSRKYSVNYMMNTYYNYLLNHPIQINEANNNCNYELVKQIRQYFINKSYNTNFCDVIINITPKIFELNIFIFNVENNSITTIIKLNSSSTNVSETRNNVYLLRTCISTSNLSIFS
jgi:hypothetical protein